MSLPFFTNDNKDCSICLSSIDKNTEKELTCNHIFHDNCITEWLKNKNSCPMCRAVVEIILPKTNIIIIPPDLIPPDLPPTYLPSTRINRYNCSIQKIKKCWIILFILVSFGYLCSTVYNLYASIITSNYINNIIKDLNETELGNHNKNTNNQYILVGYDIFYFCIFIIINYALLNKTYNNIQYYSCCCSCGELGLYAFLAILYISNLIIRFSFISNLNSYLNDSIFNFDKSYASNLNNSLIFFGSFFGFKIFIGLIAVFKSM
jgi:hypothetical protein